MSEGAVLATKKPQSWLSNNRTGNLKQYEVESDKPHCSRLRFEAKRLKRVRHNKANRSSNIQWYVLDTAT